MLEDSQNLLARILLALAQGERNVEDARKEIANEDSYDIQAIFRTLDNNGDNHITPKDLQKYLLSKGLEVNFVEIKLLILFYDQDHDFSLTYGEIFKIIHPGKELPQLPKYKQDEELNVRVDRKLYNLLEKEILLSRSVLALFEEIKHKRDFNIHSAFHLLKYYACITGDSINTFLKNCGMEPTAGDVRAIVKRLDINKDDIIDFCEFHAFLGYPDCTFCCPCFPCPNCGVKYCPDCLQDIPCYLLGCDHKGMDSKMRCTSLEHNPGLEGASSLIFGSLGASKTGSFNKTKFSSRDEEEDEKNNNFSRNKTFGQNSKLNMKEYNNDNQFYPPGFNNGQNRQFYSPGQNGYNRGNISPEQFKLLQGLTNPEQLNKFMTISGIIDRQNSEEINLTDNLSLRLSPIRDFDPKDWGCRNCPCNIHSNPNVSCDCCTCDICPFKKDSNQEKQKQKQRIFPRVSLYSYSYSYEPDSSLPNSSFLSNSFGLNNSMFMNNPKKRNVYFDKEVNKYKKTRANSSDDEKEYEDYMTKVRNIQDTFGNRNMVTSKNYNNNPLNNMIYNDEEANNNYNQDLNNNIDNNYERENNNININNVDFNQNEEEENIRTKKLFLQKLQRNEEINNENINIIKKMKKKKKGKKNLNNENYDNNENDDDNDNDNENEYGNENGDKNENGDYNKNGDYNENGDNNENRNDYGNQGNNENAYQNNVRPDQDLDSNQQQGINNYNTLGPNNNKFNNNNSQNFGMSRTSPITYHGVGVGGNNIPNNNNYNINNDNNDNNNNIDNNDNNNNDIDNIDNNNNKIHGSDPFGITTKTIYNIDKRTINNNRRNQRNNKSKIDEESEEEISNNNYLYKSNKEIIDEQERNFIEYLKALIKSEREIEFARRDLMRQRDFNGEDAFRLFEVEGTNVVTRKDLIYGLKLLGIKPTKNQITIIFNKYDLNGNNFMEYDDFFDMVISFKDEDRKEEEKRKPNRKIGNRKIEIFHPRTRELYKKLFLVIIDEEERLEQLKQSLNINDDIMKEIFRKINVDQDGICNKNEFANYCLRNRICKERKDAYLAFIRLNKNRDGGLDRKEFNSELKSSILQNN